MFPKPKRNPLIPVDYANRGKWAEGKVAEAFKAYECYSTFSWYRLPDTHAGSHKVTLADFQTMHHGEFRLVEVKEVKHGYRLPHKNFSEDKVARLRAWAMAGASVSVIVAHRREGEKVCWRVCNLESFLTREGGSWDLSNIHSYDNHKQALESIYGPLPPKRS
jgi:hypothetical protein